MTEYPIAVIQSWYNDGLQVYTTSFHSMKEFEEFDYTVVGDNVKTQYFYDMDNYQETLDGLYEPTEADCWDGDDSHGE